MDTKDLTASPPKTFEVRMGAMSEPLTIQLARLGSFDPDALDLEAPVFRSMQHIRSLFCGGR